MGYDQDYSNEPVVYLEHGMEWREGSKALNYFLKSKESYDKLAERLEFLQNFSGKLFSLDIKCPDYGALARSRLCDASSDRYRNLDYSRISSICENAITVQHRDLPHTSLVVGDSHSVAAWVPHAAISRNDGKTLYGALKLGLDHFIEPFSNWSKDHLRAYFGNIDIRFHLARQDDPDQAARDLANNYIRALAELQAKHGIKRIEVVAALPIESEARVLPKTGWYKGQPFYGDWSTRTRLQQTFNMELMRGCGEHGFVFVIWSARFINSRGELSFDVMEKPRSVHIAPKYYLWRIDEQGTDELDLEQAA